VVWSFHPLMFAGTNRKTDIYKSSLRQKTRPEGLVPNDDIVDDAQTEPREAVKPTWAAFGPDNPNSDDDSEINHATSRDTSDMTLSDIQNDTADETNRRPSR
jgi:hypothetical protein